MGIENISIEVNKFRIADVVDEYEKDKKLLKDDVRILTEWLEKEEHLPKISELKLILFLQCCYYKIEEAKVCIENFYTCRTHCPEIFYDRNVSSKIFRNQMKMLLVYPLPEYTKHRIMFIRLMDTNPDLCVIESAFKLFDIMTQMTYFRRGASQAHVVVIDATGTKFGHALKFNLVATKKFMHYVQECMPVRLKAIHVVNMVGGADKIFTIVKPFIKGELLQMMHLHPNLQSLYEEIPKDLLPKEFGGKSGSFKELHAQQYREVEEYATFFLEDQEERTDESKRRGKPKNMGDIFGIEGTFRKLEID